MTLNSILLPLALAVAIQTSGQAAPAFRKIVLESKCADPMELAPLPDGRVLWVERFGPVRIWKPDTQSSVLAANFAVHANVNAFNAKQEDRGSWESGVIGVTLAPDFEESSALYIYYSPKGTTPENRVSRFILKGDTLDLGSEQLILAVPVQREVCCHEAGSLAFDGAGNLFLSTGDNTNPFECDGYNPVDFRAGRYPFDAARSAGNANDLRGKILRIRPKPQGGYEIPQGNLFPPGTPNTRPEIYVMGCRNPFRIAVDKATGTLSWGDVGPDAREHNPERGPAGFDEINRTRTAGNFGWPFLIADNKPYRQYDFATKQAGPSQDPAKPLNLSPNNTGPKELPPGRAAWMSYPYAPSARFRAVGSGARSACAGPVYRFDPALKSERKLPQAYDNCFFIYDWERHWIIAVKLNAAGETEKMERFAPEIALKRPIDMELGADGALYLIEFGTGWENNKDSQIIRIEPAPGGA